MEGVKKNSIRDVLQEDIEATGISPEDAREFYLALIDVIDRHPEELGSEDVIWREVMEAGILKPSHPHPLHQLVYYSVYSSWDHASRGPPPYWFPRLLDFYISRCYLGLGSPMDSSDPKS